MSDDNVENNREASTAASERLLHLLKTRGPQLAAGAGLALGTSGEAARQQFVKLASQGLVEARSEVRGVGRPSQVWHLTAAAQARFPDSHAELTVQLLNSVRDTFGADAVDRFIDAREQQRREAYRCELEGAADLAERVARLAAVRTREGYMAEWSEQADGSLLLAENHCPICAAASACQGFCRAELNVFQDVLQARVERVEHILANARRCAYRISVI